MRPMQSGVGDVDHVRMAATRGRLPGRSARGLVRQRRTTLTEYKTTFGVVEFEPETRQANGKNVTQLTLLVGNEIKVRVSVWPELAQIIPAGTLKQGLLVGVRGTYSSNTSKDGATVYHNISARQLGIGDKVYEQAKTQTVQKAAAAADGPAF